MATIKITDELIEDVYLRMLELVDIAKVSSLTGQDEGHLNYIFDLVKDEAKQTLKLVKGMSFSDEACILEVGAGYGLASICFTMMGFSVTALEPGDTGFEDYIGTSSAFAQVCEVKIDHIESGAEIANFIDKPKYDLIISNNVLEHIHELDKAINNLSFALKSDGLMVHSCPNYVFPYEPHFGIPLLPFFPSLTRYLLPKKISTSDVWASLNFITSFKIKNTFRKEGLYVAFRRGTMCAGISRLRDEEIFAARHRLLQRFFSVNLIFWIARKILNIPTSLATPMDFIVCFPENKDDNVVARWLGTN
jgi:2-polyprenyl-3-methyl-5-hydroxy-6-metoxy-1,4-benzoquinol methylase